MTLETGKSAISSIGVWGSLISIVPIILETVSEVAGTGLFGPHSAAIVAGVGGVISLWGRFFATRQITSLLPK